MELKGLDSWYRVCTVYTSYNNKQIRRNEQFYRVDDKVLQEALKKEMAKYGLLSGEEVIALQRDLAEEQIIVKWFKDNGWESFIECMANCIPWDATDTTLFSLCPEPKINMIANDYLSDEGNQPPTEHYSSKKLAFDIFTLIEPYLTDKVLSWLGGNYFYHEYFEIERMDEFPLWKKMNQQ